MRNSETEGEEEGEKKMVIVEGESWGEEARLYVLIDRNTASNQCTALRLAEQL